MSRITAEIFIMLGRLGPRKSAWVTAPFHCKGHTIRLTSPTTRNCWNMHRGPRVRPFVFLIFLYVASRNETRSTSQIFESFRSISFRTFIASIFSFRFITHRFAGKIFLFVFSRSFLCFFAFVENSLRKVRRLRKFSPKIQNYWIFYVVMVWLN
jgi:hypothetical protein